MKKIGSLLIAVLLTVSGVLAGCSSKETGADSKSKTISFMHWRGEDKDAFEELIKKFTEETGIKVEMAIYPSEQYPVQTVLRDGSTGDVFASNPGYQLQSLKKLGFYEDLSGEKFLDNFDPKLIEIGNVEGKQLAVPLQLVFNQPVYNQTLFEELGLEPAKDWEGFLKLCQTLKDNGYIPIAFPGADIGSGQFMNSMMMNNAPDEKIFDKLMSGKAKLTEEWWIKTLEQFKELADKEYIQKDSLGTKHDAAIALVAQEKAAMLATGSYAIASIRNLNPDIKLGLLAPITVPEDKAKYEGIHTTTFLLGVNKNSRKKEEAKKFIEFLSRPENASAYANQTSQHVTVKDVSYESEDLNNIVDWTTKKTRFQPRYLIPDENVEKAVLSSIQAVLGGESPGKAAEAAQAIVNQHIKK
ncbi:ABC transporter substrate-binding protein [Bacillus canaveralius]|uniref:ABC transporter substrate-binding protein n=1 Tax=Bacillus canaveralius TaxID=1403243 RepID=A0A2N5GQW1_9BACI|nr:MULTISPECIES: extracellular solute-binding protein [Bacillus]PLR85601.1 ABC transporter substrate-binding protein [Bacillus canaveralius]PLR86440.1 ABC transporter substrate-binding protein [Bacillus sp. V33-4]PLR94738.1 ABC transporter substrate-binding protein [Bacillus canaveralius]RSK51834.1 extracellular solute-binding protein [Bacillus canaveralius]